MTILRTGFAAIAAAVILTAVTSSAVQQQATGSRLVLAAVTGAQNQPLTELGPDDFVISENGQTREVVAVYGADYPVVILVDNGSGAGSDLEAMRNAVSRFLSRVGQRFVALGTLANPPAMLTAIEDERSTVLARLTELTASPSSVLLPIEAVAAASRAVQDSGSPFAAIVVVSTRPVDSAQPESTRLLPGIFDSNAIVHVVSRSDPATAARVGADAPRPEADLLRDLADQTRGYFTTVFSAASYAVALNNLADRLGTEMIVEYVVPPGPVPRGEVQVGVKIPGAHVRGLRVSK